MAGISRNAACPCGSGKKYKRCCLQASAKLQRETRLRDAAIRLALDWLDEEYEEEMDAFLWNSFLTGWSQESLSRLPEELVELMFINGREYGLCEGMIAQEQSESSSPVLALDLVLGPGGPLIDAVQRRHLENMREAPLSLYEVVTVQRGSGIELQDLLDESMPLRRVVEEHGSQALLEGDLVAARLLCGPPWHLSGAIYEFPIGQAASIVDDIRKTLAQAPADLDRRRLQGQLIIDTWIRVYCTPLPSIVDHGGDPILLGTDHYRVKDRAGLAAAMADQPDVGGDAQRGWARLETPEENFSRTLLAINPGKTDDRIEVFARTQPMAQAGREWFQKVAGDTVELIAGEVTDPLSSQGLSSGRPFVIGVDGASGAVDPALLPEGFWQDLAETRLYENWADEPIPALDDKTPRESVRTENGRRRVKDLLDSYRLDEERNARQQGREAMDLTFLWEELGLSPSDEHR